MPRRIPRSVAAVAAVVATVAVLGAACGGGSGDRDAETTLVFARGADSESLDPAIVTDGESVKVITNVMETLVGFRYGTAELAPGLATSWSASADGLVWTFDLRDAKFHDGTTVDAEAVVFSFERQKDPAHPAHTAECPYWQDSFGVVESVKAVGPKRVEIRLTSAFAPFEASMALFSMSIVSPAAWKSEGIDPATGKYRYRFGEKPVGSGPYRFVRWTRGDRIVLDRFDGWWGAADSGAAGPGTPPSRIVWKVVKDNTQRLLAVESGQADVIDGVNPQDEARARANPSLVVATQPGLNIAYFAMNNTRKPFDDPRVRRAVAHLVSKETIRKAAYDGAGEVAVTPVPRAMPGWIDPGSRPRDVDAAKALLREAGLPDGFEFTILVMDNPRPYMPRPKDVAIQIQQDLAAAGIRAKIDVKQFNRVLDDAKNARHDAVLLGWSADYSDPDNFLFVLLDKTTARVGSANNVSFYTDEAVHALLLAARETTDRAARMKLYAEAQKRIHEDAPMLPLVTLPEIRVLSKRVRNYAIHPAGGEFLGPVRLE
ncbi:MAG: Periplasmic dipeptide transport protein [Planctomycetes bacterium]|nr:Periplasmic dipeptide transport protein [Planctomycetota bacterium]